VTSAEGAADKTKGKEHGLSLSSHWWGDALHDDFLFLFLSGFPPVHCHTFFPELTSSCSSWLP